MWSLETIKKNNFEKTTGALRKEIKTLKQLLSSLCQYIEGTSQLSIVETIEEGKLTKWWSDFKEAEARDISNKLEREKIKAALEQKEHKEEPIRNRALEKLTIEEKKVIGIK